MTHTKKIHMNFDVLIYDKSKIEVFVKLGITSIDSSNC